VRQKTGFMTFSPNEVLMDAAALQVATCVPFKELACDAQQK